MPNSCRRVLNVMQELTDDGMTSIAVAHEPGVPCRAADVAMFMDAGKVADRAPVAAFCARAAPERVVQFRRRTHV